MNVKILFLVWVSCVGAAAAVANELNIELPVGGVFIKTKDCGGVVVRELDGRLELVIMPRGPIAGMGPSLTVSRQGEFGDPELMWVVKSDESTYKTVRKVKGEAFPTTMLEHRYLDAVLAQIVVTKVEHQEKFRSVRDTAKSGNREQAK
jgi:hypothetical protein